MTKTDSPLQSSEWLDEILIKVSNMHNHSASFSTEVMGPDEAKQAILKKFQEAQVEARIDGRRIQAEATFDKWPASTEKSLHSFYKFLEAQVEAHRYELAELDSLRPQREGK